MLSSLRFAVLSSFGLTGCAREGDDAMTRPPPVTGPADNPFDEGAGTSAPTTATDDEGFMSSDEGEAGEGFDEGIAEGIDEGAAEGTTGGSLSCVDQEIGISTGVAVVIASTVDATDDVQSTCRSSNGIEGPSPDYVLHWTASATDLYTFDLQFSNYDTMLVILDGDCEGIELACNDDCVGTASALSLEVQEGTSLLIVIDGYGQRSGSFQLDILANGGAQCDDADTASASASDGTSASASG